VADNLLQIVASAATALRDSDTVAA